MTKRFHIAVMMSGVAMFALCVSAPAHAQGAAAEASERAFDVPAQPLSQAVLTFSQQAGVQLVLESGVAQGISSSVVSGRMSVAEAVTRLLQGTSLTWRFVNDRTITIEAAPKGEGERVLGAVRVEGEQGSPYFGGAGKMAGVNGINGSRDITATEGTGSFTSGALTIGSKAPQAIKDVPQSVSVITSERLEQQNITDFTEALAQAPGVSLVQDGNSLQNKFFSRGFEITSIQVDGGAPFQTAFDTRGFSNPSGFFPQIDMAQYDHVELLRGAAGLFNGFGNPSGTVNLVRKKPLDHPQFTIELQAGSWSNYRTVADATAPLALDGKLRGRAVFAFQDNDFFYDVAHENKTSLYGILEYDLSPSTLLTAGISHIRQDDTPWRSGLPRYQDGSDLHLPRSTSFALPWNRWNFKTTELFATIDQKLGEEWQAKLNFGTLRQKDEQKLADIGGGVNPVTGAGTILRAGFDKRATDQWTAELTVSGGFTLFGQHQEIVAGLNRTKVDGGGVELYSGLIDGTPSNPYYPYPGSPPYCYDINICPAGVAPPVDVFDFDPTDPRYAEPSNILPYQRSPTVGQKQTGAYVNLNLTAFDRLHLALGFRFSWNKNFGTVERICRNISSCPGLQVGDVIPSSVGSDKYHGRNITWPPTASLSFDISKQLKAYVGYADIFQNQGYAVDADLQEVDPITGSNIEAGLKWQSADSRINASLAFYRIKQRNYAGFDESRVLKNPDGTWYFDENFAYYLEDNQGNRYKFGTVDSQHSCCYLTGYDYERFSKGFEAELSGEILPGWNVSANYSYNKNQYRGDDIGLFTGIVSGTVLESRSPRNIYKLWSSYAFDRGQLKGLTISGGMNGQSSIYVSGYACAEFMPPNDQGVSQCAPGQNLPYDYTQPSFIVFSGRLDYQISNNWSASFNLNNIFDQRYYKTPGGSDSGNWYGEPRAITFSLRGKW